MDHRQQPDLSHLPRFCAASLEYNFVILDKSQAELPLNLQTAAPVKVGVLSVRSPHLQKLLKEDLDLILIQNFRKKIRPENLERDLKVGREGPWLSDKQEVVWIRCQGRGPDALPRTALYPPIKFRDMAMDQVTKLHDTYYWINMRIWKTTERPALTASAWRCTRKNRRCPMQWYTSTSFHLIWAQKNSWLS